MNDPANPYDDIRDAIAKLCAQFPGSYWRALDREMGYPTEFVAALTQAGWLGALVPEEYGGSGKDMVATIAIIEELASRSLGIASGFIFCACYAGLNI